MKKFLIALLTIASISICQAQTSEDITTLLLVRHAEKMDDGTQDPDLTPEGQVRAQKLKDIFMHAGIDIIYSTPYKRTMGTVAPIAQANNLTIEAYNPSDKNFIHSIYEKNKGKTVLISGHSNTTPMAVNSLLKMDKYDNIAHEEYGRIFIVTIDSKANSSVLEIQY